MHQFFIPENIGTTAIPNLAKLRYLVQVLFKNKHIKQFSNVPF
jgi:hypothetical protein